MPIKKFKTFDEATKDLWVFNPDDKYYKRLENAFDFWRKLNNKKIEKGIKKFKTFKEFNDYKESKNS